VRTSGAALTAREVQKHSRRRDLRTLTLHVYDGNRANLAGRVATLVSGLLA
jgi:hypothetical protein